jgi:hypothetical protein
VDGLRRRVMDSTIQRGERGSHGRAHCVERLFFSDSPFSIAVLALPSVTMGIITVLRSRPLRNDPRGFEIWIPLVALFSVMFVAAAALFGVVQSS